MHQLYQMSYSGIEKWKIFIFEELGHLSFSTHSAECRALTLP